MRISSRTLMVVGAIIAIVVPSFGQDFETVFKTYALEGDPAPDGDGVFDRFNPPRFNDSRTMVFSARMTDTDRIDGMFYAEMDQLVQQFLRDDSSSPTGAINPLGVLFSDYPHISNAGALANGHYELNSDIQALYTMTSPNGLTAVLEPGDVVPGLGTLYSMDTGDDRYGVNNNGAYTVGVRVEQSPDPTTSALIQGNLDPLISPTIIFEEGDAAPEGDGLLRNAILVAQNDAGQVAFNAGLVPGTYTLHSGGGLYVYSDGSGIQNILRGTHLTPNGDAEFADTKRVLIGGGGDVAFLVDLVGLGFNCENDGAQGIFRYSNGSIVKIAQSNDASPVSGFDFCTLQSSFTVNAGGTVAFASSLSPSSPMSGGATIMAAFRYSEGGLQTLAVTGDLVPGTTDHVFGQIYGSFLNENGDVLFVAEDVGPSGTIWSQWIADADGTLHRLVAAGEIVEVTPGDFRTISNVYFLAFTGGGEDGRDTFLNDWSVCARLVFADGTEGVFTIQLIELLPEDVNDDGIVDVQDLLALLAAWGPCIDCPEDIDGNEAVNVADLLSLLAAWGQTN